MTLRSCVQLLAMVFMIFYDVKILCVTFGNGVHDIL